MNSPLSARIRTALQSGRSKEEVVRELVAEGLSERAAEGFVATALAELRRPANGGGSTPAAPDSGEEDTGGRGALIAGALWFSLGATITAATYLLASPGQEYVVAYGALVAGLLAFGRGLLRWSKSSQPFPRAALVLTLALPPVAASVLLGGIRWSRTASTESRRAEEEKRLDAARAVQEEARAAAERKAQDEARAQRHRARIARAREQLQLSTHSSTLCDTALALGDSGAREAIPDLEALLKRTTESTSVRSCAAAALVALGETEDALAFYLECARAWTSECRRIALGGFGDIGPPVAEVALPYVDEALQSPHWDLRFVAVEAASKLGPPAEPLLRRAASDDNEHVRERAERALDSLRAGK